MATKPKRPRPSGVPEQSLKRIAAAKVQHAKRVVRTAADIKFAIVWNETRRSWDVHREGKSTGGFSYDRSTAIGLAIKAAGFETIESLKAVVTSTQDGKTKIEWSS
jgi:hypothetical protein